MKALLTLVCILGLLSCLGRAGPPSNRVSALEMKPGDHLLIRYKSNGCFHNTTHDLIVTRTATGATLTGIDHSPAWDPKTKTQIRDPKIQLLTATLTEAELGSLDKSFEYCRANPNGGCTTVNDITTVIQRGDAAIAGEKFTDGTCRMDDDPACLGFWRLVQKITPKKA